MKTTKIVFLAFSLMPAVALAQTNNANIANENGNSIMFVSKEDLAKARNYWTEERLRNATPKAMPDISVLEIANIHNETAKLIIPKVIAKSILPKNSPSRPSDIGIPTEADVKEIPFNNAGKLYFTESDGTEHSCTAQFVGQLNILLTAATCIRDKKTGQYYSNFKFHQAYREGEETAKILGVGAATRDSWVVGDGEHSNRKVDYGFIITETESQSGAMGLIAGLPFNDLYAIGYASNYSNSKILQKVQGKLAGVKDGVAAMSGNPFARGAGGGAWIAELSPGSQWTGNYVVGNNASHKSDDPNTDYGPFYDEGFESLYKQVATEAGKYNKKPKK
ncbi:hypothetical protein KC222_17450 [Cedecea davisae]|uniref:V8-like Glu-specific endopeptidase n=1 Tax=Cedecea davisae TaxID=158484 RepID=A0ABS6DKP8_9ENTR|nr:hypothetical protein [Cedecea davisae]MBU4683798.1 hypothetical protein [Cedecea davisae]MBU4687017.1 hypothetical protein [Cedecea davisae]